ncbi:Zinc finger domain-containing CCHC-type [Fusarium albosuccineum]|uniref:Zinc finger domain-containing CCHC-type n=1 Tax=Fusarium albosuccineum TaxID=1237068 RepID=A0A8H4LM76_9HYPO|nr:Zinc finger domain-containing CCHC-type [Fusarium albosuccineum]
MAPETPRGVSSRLLTMKFMQRAVASGNSSPDPEAHSAKKRKLGHSPATGRIDVNIDEAAIKAALSDQEAKRQAALDKHVGGDTHWVLNNAWSGSKAASNSKQPLNVVYVGYGDIDSSNDSGDNEDAPARGRTSTGNYKSSKNQACWPLQLPHYNSGPGTKLTVYL